MCDVNIFNTNSSMSNFRLCLSLLSAAMSLLPVQKTMQERGYKAVHDAVEQKYYNLTRPKNPCKRNWGDWEEEQVHEGRF